MFFTLVIIAVGMADGVGSFPDTSAVGMPDQPEPFSDSPTDSDCLNIIQHLHGLEFDLDVSSKHLTELKIRLNNLVDTESGYEADLTEQSASLKQFRQLYLVDKSLAVSTQMKLRETELNITNMSKRINSTSFELKSVEVSLRNSTAGIDVLQNQITENESTSRRLELALQMLQNDMETGNKTLMDSKSVLAERKHQVQQLLVSMRSLMSSVSKNNASLVSDQRTHLLTIAELQKEKRYFSDAQQAHFVESRKLDGIREQISQIKQRVNSEKLEVTTTNRTISSYQNTTLSSLNNSLAAIVKEVQSLSNELAATKSESELVRGSLRGNENAAVPNMIPDSSSFPDVTPDQLRQSIRESKLLLAREGYGDRFSFIELPPSSLSVDADIHLFKDRSKLLSLEEELREQDEEESKVKNALKDAVAKSKDLVAKYKKEFEIELRDEAILGELNIKAQNASASLESISIRVAQSQSRIANLSTIESTQKEKLVQAGSILYDAQTHLDRTNATISNTLGAVSNVAKEVENKENQLVKMKQDHLRINEDIKRLQTEIETSSSDAEEARHRSTMLEDQISRLTADLDDLRKSHTEALAEGAQLTRRLEDKSQHMQESNASVQAIELTISQLESRISDLLNERTDLQSQLRGESDKKRTLQLRVDALKLRGSQAQCNT